MNWLIGDGPNFWLYFWLWALSSGTTCLGITFVWFGLRLDRASAAFEAATLLQFVGGLLAACAFVGAVLCLIGMIANGLPLWWLALPAYGIYAGLRALSRWVRSRETEQSGEFGIFARSRKPWL